MDSEQFVADVTSGDERRALEAMREALAMHMLIAEPNVVAQVAARLQAVIERIAALAPPEKRETASDEIARRRAARRATSELAQAATGAAPRQRRRGSGTAS